MTTVGVFTLIRHTKSSAGVMFQRPLKLIIEVLAPYTLSSPPRPSGITTLNHKALDIPMERDIPVIPLPGQFQEIPHSLGRVFRVQFQVQVSGRRRHTSVALAFYPAALQHVVFVGQER